MVETEDLTQLRLYNLALLRRLRAGQAAIQRSVARAASQVGALGEQGAV